MKVKNKDKVKVGNLEEEEWRLKMINKGMWIEYESKGKGWKIFLFLYFYYVIDLYC